MGKRLNQKETIIDNTFVYTVALNIMNDNKDHELTSINKCRHRYDWPEWKVVIQVELNSLKKHDVLGPVVQTPKVVIPVG